MQNARLTLDPSFTVGPINRNVFGGFVEHLGRHVYDGIHEPAHETADEHRLPLGGRCWPCRQEAGPA